MRTYKQGILLPLKKQLLLIIIVFLVCISIITSVTCTFYTKIHTETLQKQTTLYTSQLSVSVNEIYRTCHDIAYSLSYDQMIQNYLITETSADKYKNYNLAYNQIINLMNLSPYIKDIAVIGNSGNSATVNGDYEAYTEIIRGSDLLNKSLASYGTASIKDADCQILSIPIYHLTATDTSQIGFLFIAVDINTFFLENPVSNTDYISQCILTDSNKTKISGSPQFYSALLKHPDDTEIHMNSEHYLVTQSSIPIVGNTLYILVNKDMITASGKQIAKIHFICMFILMLIIVGIIFKLYHPLIKSLQTLTSYMKSVSSEKISNYKDGVLIQQGFLGSTEIKNISDSFNYMLLRIYKLNHTIFENHTRMYEMEINNKKTEIAFLRSQINPHFLYNTLTMICGMASIGMKQEIIDTASSLSQIFRYAIKGNEMVTLEEELKIVQSYLQIQLYRFEDRFTVNYNLPDELLPCMIPKMILQPLIENAIVHGLEPSRTQGNLEIGARKNPEKEYLVIWVFDTGIGMPDDKKDAIREALSSLHTSPHKNLPPSDCQDSIGLFNVNNRMKLYFGAEYSLTLDSEEGIGTNVQLRIPYHTSNKQKKER